jgi:predicted porin
VKRGACALLMLTLAGAAAQAQNAVKLYGVMDLGIVSDRDSGKSASKVESGNQTASRWGVTGTEDLGGGLQASFVLESQIDADTGTSSHPGRIFGSQSWVGLSGGFGSVKLGRMFTPYFGAIAVNDPFDARGPGESTRLFQDGGVRMDNTVKYSLPPVFGGVYGDLAYAAGETAGNSSANRQVSMDAGYLAGPLNVQFAHHDSKDAQGKSLARSSLVGGNYDFGPVRGWLILARSRNDTGLDTRDNLVGVSAPFGRHAVSADYVRKDDRARANADAHQLALAYYYTLSKRSNLYLIASRLNNDGAANYQASLPGGGRRLLAAGMRHQF